VEPLKTHVQATTYYRPFQALPQIIFWQPTVKPSGAPLNTVREPRRLLTPIDKNIPQELKDRPNWVAYRPDKTPVNPKTGGNAKADDPATWGAFNQAVECYEARKGNGVAGIGYEFSANDPYAGVDLDKCRNPRTGEIEPWARAIIDRLKSYTEVSPSGCGVHILVAAKLPPRGNRKGQIEMYDSGRYFTMTGHHLKGTPTTIEDRQDELTALHTEIFGQDKKEAPKGPGPSPAYDLADSELIERARAARNGDKFDRLMSGDTSGHLSASEADLALCSILSFWTQDHSQIDRIFRTSGLYRNPGREKKWDRATAGSTYGAKTIEKVLSQTTENNTNSITKELWLRVKVCLEGGGFTPEEISYVTGFANKLEKPTSNINLPSDVREWVLSSNGVFESSDFVKEAGLSSLSSREFNKNLSKVFERLIKEGLIERVGPRRGCFRRIEKESAAIDFLNADCSTIFDLRWPAPFNLERLVNIYPKNIIVVAGTSNAGKTGLLLNVVRENMARHRVNYFSSEMGAEELRLRLEKFQLPINEWKFEASERSANFADAIDPTAVNIIDYFELTDNFYQVGGEIKKVFDRLTTGIAIIAIQKKEGQDLGRGAGFTLEKARLYISMEAGELKIVKGKNWAQPGHNPNGKVFRFKLVDGCRFLIKEG